LQLKGLLSSVIVTVVVFGVPSWAPPVGLAKLTMNVSSFSGWLSLMMFIVKVLSTSSLSLQYNVPVDCV
jgi:hypothetical protein